MRINCFLILFLTVFLSANAQITRLKVFEPDSTDAGFKIVRIKDVKLKYLTRSAKLTDPRTVLNRVKPLSIWYNRFKPTSFWKKVNKFGLNISEVAFVNWNAGGDNSVSALASADFARNYKFRYLNWNNEVQLRYGLNAQEGRKLRKTDDQIRLSTTLSFRKDTITNWYYSVKANLRTQFSNGYKYPDRENPISRFMAPGYLFVGVGTSYIPPKDQFNLYISPATMKSTFVLDEVLSNQGAFGVEEGKSVFLELGFLVTNTWETEIARNVLMNHRINLYTDYISSFGNIDVDWELNFNLKVNEYLNANIGTHLIFDDDTKFDEEIAEDGTVINPGIARIQFKQLLGVGLLYSF
ncbi:DUF3078 domain-containing protein [Flagellimonas halotolerans]|uniref:DUF3078 domain-containing protein n=1 Tax=Flagellimonas halotolerans TaxID=3112164 RepID=A0ABU6ILU0_9FLAO|nr:MULTISPECIES: DUF3078 domain-containing protein [unclassified Allomuricauda]MEC3964131.1 DUF3078 domain-containing protein [Muricauda sp. SYSU M86414]MEC4264001.1 DUF3078 domain-containing protein [Muricauda sp. SYSU M84420]